MTEKMPEGSPKNKFEWLEKKLESLESGGGGGGGYGVVTQCGMWPEISDYNQYAHIKLTHFSPDNTTWTQSSRDLWGGDGEPINIKPLLEAHRAQHPDKGVRLSFQVQTQIDIDLPDNNPDDMTKLMNAALVAGIENRYNPNGVQQVQFSDLIVTNAGLLGFGSVPRYHISGMVHWYWRPDDLIQHLDDPYEMQPDPNPKILVGMHFGVGGADYQTEKRAALIEGLQNISMNNGFQLIYWGSEVVG